MTPAEATFQAFLEEHLQILEPLAREAALASWEFQTTGSPQAKDQAKALRTQIALLYADREKYAFLKNLPVKDISPPQLKRQHTLLLHAFLERQIDPDTLREMVALEVEISDRFNHFRAQIQGREVTDNEIDQILAHSRDEALRKEAWEASKQVGAVVADKVLELARLRNREAQRLGYPNYFEMRLEIQELDGQRLEALLHQLAQTAEPIWRTYREALDARLAARFGLTPEAVRPWHHANRFFQSPETEGVDLDPYFAEKDLEAITAQFYADIGLPVEDILLRSDLYERPGKCQHAFCTDIDRKGDIRVLCNCRPNARWMGTMLHEFGHAVYDKYLDAELPYLLRRPAHTMATEAVALWAGSLVHNPHWLTRYAEVPATAANALAPRARTAEAEALLVFMHWCLVMYHFERSLYENPDADLNTLWWHLVERYQRVRRPERRNTPDWAAKIHLATASAYYHNYLLGHLIAAQVKHHMQGGVSTKDAEVPSPKWGNYLRERLFAPGALYPWEEWLERATAEPLNPRYFVQQLQGVVEHEN